MKYHKFTRKGVYLKNSPGHQCSKFKQIKWYHQIKNLKLLRSKRIWHQKSSKMKSINSQKASPLKKLNNSYSDHDVLRFFEPFIKFWRKISNFRHFWLKVLKFLPNYSIYYLIITFIFKFQWKKTTCFILLQKSGIDSR